MSPCDRPSTSSDSVAHDSMLMKPGVTASPFASTTVPAGAPVRSPRATMRSPRMARSVRLPALPVPSYTVPPRMTTSNGAGCAAGDMQDAERARARAVLRNLMPRIICGTAQRDDRGPDAALFVGPARALEPDRHGLRGRLDRVPVRFDEPPVSATLDDQRRLAFEYRQLLAGGVFHAGHAPASIRDRDVVVDASHHRQRQRMFRVPVFTPGEELH